MTHFLQFHRRPFGLHSFITGDPDVTYVGISNFLGYSDWCEVSPIIQSMSRAEGTSQLDMKELYGFETEDSLDVSVYFSRIDLKFAIPAANLTGTMFRGKIRVSHLTEVSILGMTGCGSSVATVLDLIRIADKVETMHSGFLLQSAIVKDYLLTQKSPSTLLDVVIETTSPTINVGSE